jgi:hypothetical protein
VNKIIIVLLTLVGITAAPSSAKTLAATNQEMAPTQTEDGNMLAANTSTTLLVRVFLQGGQSNSDGLADPANLPPELSSPQTNIDLYYKVYNKQAAMTYLQPGLSKTGGFGPEVSFGDELYRILKPDSHTKIAIIKYAHGGTSLYKDWKAGGDATRTGDGTEYRIFQNTVSSGLNELKNRYPNAKIKIEGMIWMQGERDTRDTQYTNAYQNNLKRFIADIRKTYGKRLPFVIGRLSVLQTDLPAGNLNKIQQAQDYVANNDSYTRIVNTDSFTTKSDHLHFNATSQVLLGRAFASQLIVLQRMARSYQFIICQLT